MTVTDLLRSSSSETRRGGEFRAEIEGLRAVAIASVLAFHAGLPAIRGGFAGVDIFFVISGYLITSLVLRETDRTDRFDMMAFYSRRARRLLPATTVVLMFSAVVTLVWLPTTQRAVFGGDIIATAMYVINWRLASRSVDYLAEGTVASPVQHFWSLAVEEQFYIVWPVVVALALLLLKLRQGRRKADHRASTDTLARRWVAAGLTVLVVVSLVWAFGTSAFASTEKYFVTPSRLWELAVGCVLAIFAARLGTLSPRLASSIGWLGLCAIGVSVFFFSSSTAWPGPWTLVPVLGTAAVILAGLGGNRGRAVRLLSGRAAVWLGGLSYSVYLWHWPILIAARGLVGEDLSAVEGTLAVLVSILPAWATHRWIENPFRFSPRCATNMAALKIAVTSFVLSVLSGIVVIAPWSTSAPARPSEESTPRGAEVVISDPAAASDLWQIDTFDWVTPEPAAATSDIPVSYVDGCQVDAESSEAVLCEYGVPSDTVIVLAGDSKALQWQPVLDQIATERSWRLITMTKSGCALSSGVQPLNDGPPYLSCVGWNEGALTILKELAPTIVLTSQYASSAYSDEQAPEGTATVLQMEDDLVTLWSSLSVSGTKVVVLLDNPTPPFEAYECVADHLTELSACAFDAVHPGRTNASVPQTAAALRVPAVTTIDLTDLICPGGRCPAVMGNVLTYRQGSHLTKTFVETFQAPLDAQLASAVEEALRRQ